MSERIPYKPQKTWVGGPLNCLETILKTSHTVLPNRYRENIRQRQDPAVTFIK